MRHVIIFLAIFSFSQLVLGKDFFPKIEFAKSCVGDIVEAKLIDVKEKENQIKNYCIKIKSSDEDFDPDGFSPLFSEKSVVDKLLMLVYKGYSKQKKIVLVKLTMKVPNCEECDSSCWGLKNTKVVEKKFEVNFENKKNPIVFDLGKEILNNNWYLKGLKVEVFVKDPDSKLTKVKSIKIPGWSWCA